MLATAALLRRAREAGASIHLGTTVTAIDRDAGGEVTGVRTDAADEPAISAPFVINAAGTWAGEVAALAGAPIPVLPRRGFILVTEPLPRVVRHKVYTAEYVANVASSDAGLETSVVIEGTRGGTVLIGASRERVGFDRTMSLPRRPAARGPGGRAVPVARGRLAAPDLPRLPARTARTTCRSSARTRACPGSSTRAATRARASGWPPRPPSCWRST